MTLAQIRIIPTEHGPRVYFDASDLVAASLADLPAALEARARYVEAVHPSGTARVLKNRFGITGIIDRSTESQANV